ncbi:MAG TPA: TRAP transporter small permease [Candidatus Marinimicrobia bacterium]|jgi:TRAP-type C4-dicarboxylate transport system permease small subunit|nr:TRAP transporter small permease [Candidatus Neomarinimicrobiota bacterium]HJL75601.1 TRAP transporter small permease [Candidatus Neomarinimicrobiota bacterium]HJM70331.1 TRAP transporter small permease [Candidatus Neomarinimicrobiota bacterium]|tara:strand:- start:2248 stop:2757 length:510 start_codon:yes stop_codon:yes gene_type:complete
MKKFAPIFMRIIEDIISLCLFAVFGITVILVVLRYFFNTSITGANEIVIILFIYSTAIGASLAIAKGEHISITFYTEKLPKRFSKTLQLIQLFLLAIINAVIFWYCFQWIEITGGYKMPMTGLPRSVALLSIPIGCGIALIFCVNSVITVLRINEGDKLPHSSEPLINK